MALRKREVDPASIRLIAFDLDGTLVEGTIFVWKTLHEHFKTDAQRRQKAADDFHGGRISYSDWFETDLELLEARGADRASILAVFDGLRPAPGARETLAELRRRKFRLGLISGSLDILLERFFPGAFDHVLINRIAFDALGRIQGGIPTPYDLEGKADGLSELARREGLTAGECAFVGDNLNDLAVLRAAGLAIGVNLKHPDVASACDLVLRDGDLSALLAVFPHAPHAPD